MAGIDDIGNGSSGSYSHEIAVEEKDIRKLTKGGEGSATADIRIGGTGPDAITPSAERNLQRAREAGLAPPIAKDVAKKGPNNRGIQKPIAKEDLFKDRLLAAEADPSDVESGMYSMYYERSTGTRNVGPGLNLEDPLIWRLMKEEGLDINWFHQNSPHADDGRGTRNRIEDPKTQAALERVFDKRRKIAEGDAIKFVGNKGAWSKLSQTQRDVFSEMSYNMGLGSLSGFTQMKAGIDALVKERSKKGGADKEREQHLIDEIAFEALNSKWANNDVPSRAIRLVNTLMIGGSDDEFITNFRNG